MGVVGQVLPLASQARSVRGFQAALDLWRARTSMRLAGRRSGRLGATSLVRGAQDNDLRGW